MKVLLTRMKAAVVAAVCVLASSLSAASYELAIDENGLLTGYTGTLPAQLVIPETVTVIGDGVFADNTSLTSVTIPATVQAIGECAFDGCTRLATVAISNGVQVIYSDAFYGCKKADIEIPASVTEIHGSAFAGVKSVSVNEENTTYKMVDGVMLTTDDTTLVYCPSSLSGDWTIPETVETIGSGALDLCLSLTSLTIPASVTTIEDYAFGWHKIGEILVDAENQNFYVSEGGLISSEGEYIVPTKMLSGAYTIPAGVTSIAQCAFACQDGLTAVTIPAEVTTIGEEAFEDCAKLKTITFEGDSVELGEDVFEESANLKAIYVTENFTDPEAFFADYIPDGCAIYVMPSLEIGEVNSYYEVEEDIYITIEASSGSTVKASRLPNGVSLKSETDDEGNPTSYWIEGAAKNASASEITITATKDGVPTVKKFTLNIGMLQVVLSETTDSEGMKSLTGAGYYYAGKTAVIQAKAEKGYAFAGWYEDSDGLSPFDFEKADYRALSVSLKLPTEDDWQLSEPIAIYAKFVSAEADSASLATGLDGQTITVDSDEFELPVDVASITIPTVKVTGLPSGLSYDADKGVISGTAKTPGYYTVTVTLSNSSTKGKVETFTMIVPNLDSSYITPSWDASTPAEVVAGLALEESQLTVTAEEGWTLSVAGLPNGLRFNAKTGEITGKATRTGYYTVTFTATKRGETAEKATRTIAVIAPELVLAVVEDEEGVSAKGMKSLTGAGKYSVGTKASLKAVANDGYVFAGWYKDAEGAEPCDEEVFGVDPRTANVSYVMTVEGAAFYAKFATKEDDADSLASELDDQEITIDGEVDREIQVTSITIPTMKITGLPKGLTFDSKTFKVTGTPTVPGAFTGTVKLSNASTNKTEKFTVYVPNFTSDKIYGLGGAEDPYQYLVGKSSDCSDLVVTAEEGWTIKVSGLPNGLKFDAKTGAITGTATKAGTYTVTFTATKKGEKAEVSTRTFVVEALPSKLVGTFVGLMYKADAEGYRGTFMLTSTDAGKITARVVDAQGTYSFTGSWECETEEDGNVYLALMSTKSGELSVSIDLSAEWPDAPLTGVFSKAASDEKIVSDDVIVAQKSLFAEPWYFKVVEEESEDDEIVIDDETASEGWTFVLVEKAADADLTVTPKGDGTVTIAGKVGDYSVSASSMLSFAALMQGDAKFTADFVTFVKDGKESKALSISCDLPFNREAGEEAAEAIIVE